MPHPTAIIVDDESNLIALLKVALASHWPELEIVGEALDGPSALKLVETHRPDLTFLDIRMPGMTGLEVAQQLIGRCHVVFVTAYEQYAIKAFENAAVDYLLKPVEEKRLLVTISRLKTRLSATPPDMTALINELTQRLQPSKTYLQWLQVQRRQDLVLVAVEEVDVFKASEKYTLAITPNQEWVIRTPLKELEDQLDPALFWRVHRNAIVRVGAIARVNRDERSRVIVHFHNLPGTIAVSRAYLHRFKQM